MPRQNGILLVVDDASLRAGLSMNVRHEGGDAFPAPLQGPANLAGLPADLAAAIIDADAESAAEWLREVHAARVPCLVLCRPERVGDWRARVSSGAGEVLAKPFRLELLLEGLRRLLHARAPPG